METYKSAVECQNRWLADILIDNDFGIHILFRLVCLAWCLPEVTHADMTWKPRASEMGIAGRYIDQTESSRTCDDLARPLCPPVPMTELRCS